MTAAESAVCRAAVLAIGDWIVDEQSPMPTRAEIAAAVRLTARTLPQLAPGASVEVRVPPFVAVQCIAGPSHTRGTPPNVVETSPRVWLRLATGVLTFDQAVEAGQIDASGARAADIAGYLPIVPLTQR